MNHMNHMDALMDLDRSDVDNLTGRAGNLSLGIAIPTTPGTPSGARNRNWSPGSPTETHSSNRSPNNRRGRSSESPRVSPDVLSTTPLGQLIRSNSFDYGN